MCKLKLALSLFRGKSPKKFDMKPPEDITSYAEVAKKVSKCLSSLIREKSLDLMIVKLSNGTQVGRDNSFATN